MKHIKTTRGETMMRIVERDIENEQAIPTQRDLSLAYSVAAERAGKKTVPTSGIKRGKPSDRITRREFEIEEEAKFSIS